MLENEILELLETIPNNKHYLNRYHKFIFSCSHDEDDYTEKHHILPKAQTMFPEFADLKTNSWNCAKLTARQHFIAHWMLWKAYGNFMAYAFLAMRRVRASSNQTNRYYKINSKTYDKLRKDVQKTQSKRLITDETRQRMREGQAARTKVTCPHCNLEGSPGNMQRWHFDNCKMITGIEKHPVKQNHEVVTCPHCDISGKAQGMFATHFDNCNVVRGNYRVNKESLTCPHCNKVGKNYHSFLNSHFDNCAVKTGIKNKSHDKYNLDLIECPHCFKKGKTHGMISKHFDNCSSIKNQSGSLSSFLL